MPVLTNPPRFGAPLSTAIVPLVTGLRRRAMLRCGITEDQRRLAGMMVHYYQLAAHAKAAGDLPIVLIHGIADNATTWNFVIRPLSMIGPVYAIDLPGFGLSGYPHGRRYASIHEHTNVVRALIREVIGRPALLVGNSLGGWIAARLTLETAELVHGVVLLDPGGALLGGRGDWEAFVDTVAVPDLRTVRRIYRQMFGVVLPPLYLGQHGFQALFLRDAVTHFVAASNEDEFLRPEDLHALTRPCGLIWGMRDSFLPAGSFEFFQTHLPDPQVLALRGCGHLPQLERPQAVTRFVRQFAERIKDEVER
ncbi:MAG: alpha/beta hydrolase [Oscillochloris sp.]|nr:alpha/beta hydrolase [Oscillochloris sp.]